MNRSKKYLALSLLLFVAAVVLLPASVGAAELELYYTPPCLLDNVPGIGPCPPSSGERPIATYISRIYRFALGAAGFLAVGAIVVGGIYYTISAGSPDKQREGKDMIFSALWGIVLLFGSWILLRTVNPQLVTLKEPSVELLTNLSSFVPAGTFPFERPVSTTITDRATAVYCQENAGDRVAECQTSNCSGCVNLYPPEVAALMKPDQCYWQKGDVSDCLVNPITNQKLLVLSWLAKQFADGGAYNWQITEVFPPTVKHKEAAHYNGCAVDIKVFPAICPNVHDLISKATAAGFTVGNEYARCDGTTYETTKGDHLHLKAC